MTDTDLEELRRHGFGVAYRMLGSVADAEDVAQEAILRLTSTSEDPDVPAAWVTTVATRLAIDHLRLARVRRETYIGPWLPEPLVEEASGPPARAELAESLSQAFLVLLESLSPVERAVFLLREIFEYDYSEIAEIVDRSEANCRQIVVRARKNVLARRPRFDADEARRDALLARFVAAAEGGDLAALEEMLAADAVLYTDGGGKAKAARTPVSGAARVARLIAFVTGKNRATGLYTVEFATVNGQAGRLLRHRDGTVIDVLTIDVVDGRIQTLRIVRNPDKLAHL
jgi:RNA polymerase sigma-70 factor (ECF subfamily)